MKKRAVITLIGLASLAAAPARRRDGDSSRHGGTMPEMGTRQMEMSARVRSRLSISTNGP